MKLPSIMSRPPESLPADDPLAGWPGPQLHGGNDPLAFLREHKPCRWWDCESPASAQEFLSDKPDALQYLTVVRFDSGEVLLCALEDADV